MGLPLGLINKINSHKKQEEKYYIVMIAQGYSPIILISPATCLTTSFLK